MTSTPVTDVRLEELPAELESPRAKLIYLYLQVAEGGTVGDLHETLNVPKLTLLSVLDALDGRGLVEQRGDAYVPVA